MADTSVNSRPYPEWAYAETHVATALGSVTAKIGLYVESDLSMYFQETH
jgi:hypothetical protein